MFKVCFIFQEGVSLLVLTAFLWEGVKGLTKPISSSTTHNPWVPPSVWTKEKIPNPRVDVNKCGRRGQRSWVCDPNNILTYEEANDLDLEVDKLRTFFGCRCEKKDTWKCPNDHNYGGWQAGIAIVNKLYMPNSNIALAYKEELAEDVADYLREESWRLGVCDDDLIIFLSVEDRIIYTKTGDQMSATLTDKCVDKIHENVKPYLRDGKWFLGLQAMVQNYSKALQRDHPCNNNSSKVIIYAVVGCIFGIVVIIVVVVSIKSRNSSLRSSGGISSDISSHHYHDSVRRDSDGSNSSGGGGGAFQDLT